MIQLIQKDKLVGVMKMTKEKLVLEAEYADIILTLLQPPYMISSITKLVFIAFCTKWENSISTYKNRSKNFVDVFFKNISLKLTAHYEDICTMFHFVDMLRDTGMVTVNGDKIELVSEISHHPENKFLQFCEKKLPNPIIEVNRLDVKAMLEEVIRYV